MSSINGPKLQTEVAKPQPKPSSTKPEGTTPSTTASTPPQINSGPNGDSFKASNPLFVGSLATATTSPGNRQAGSSPAGSTPAGSTPAGSTPAGSTPASSTPASSTPAGSTPMGSTQAGSSPAGSTPAGSTPAGSTPSAGQSVAETVLKALRDLNAPQELIDAYIEQYKLLGLYTDSMGGGSTPAGSTPVGSTPAGSTPIGSTPGASTPAGSTAAGSTPVGSTPAGASGAGHPLGQIVVTSPNKYEAEIQAAIDAAEKQYGVKIDPNIVKGMIFQESKGDPLAVGSLDAQGSKGLLQVTAANAGGTNQFIPANSINRGVQMFAEALKNNGGDLTLALGEYNQGAGAKTNANAQTYAQKVQEWARQFASGVDIPGGYRAGQLE